MKGCLDCTIGAFHMSIPVELSLLQNVVQILNQKLRKYLIGPGCDNVLRPDIADLSDHCPVILLQGECSSLALCTSVVKRLSPLHFLCNQCLQPLQKMQLLPTPVQQTVRGNSPELCRRSRPIQQIMIFVFPKFICLPPFR